MSILQVDTARVVSGHDSLFDQINTLTIVVVLMVLVGAFLLIRGVKKEKK